MAVPLPKPNRANSSIRPATTTNIAPRTPPQLCHTIETCRTLLAERLKRRLTQRVQELTGLESQLKALSPLATLGRGFAIVQLEEEGTIVRSASTLAPGDSIVTRFARGRAHAKVKTVEPTED